MRARRPLVVGNWKMNGTRSSAQGLVNSITESYRRISSDVDPAIFDVVVCPPSILTGLVADAVQGTNVRVGGQDCHAEEKGAFTGDVSPLMLRDAGASYVLVGHSERRCGHGETNTLVSQKAYAAQRAGLITIICVGEDAAIRAAGEALAFVEAQVRESLPPGAPGSQTIIAYEPVWAIGSGRIPSYEEISDMHTMLRRVVASVIDVQPEVARLLYGGSVTPSNAADIMKITNVDGVLVGGASLHADDFCAVAFAAQPHAHSE